MALQRHHPESSSMQAQMKKIIVAIPCGMYTVAQGNSDLFIKGSKKAWINPNKKPNCTTKTICDKKEGNKTRTECARLTSHLFTVKIIEGSAIPHFRRAIKQKGWRGIKTVMKGNMLRAVRLFFFIMAASYNISPVLKYTNALPAFSLSWAQNSRPEWRRRPS